MGLYTDIYVLVCELTGLHLSNRAARVFTPEHDKIYLLLPSCPALGPVYSQVFQMFPRLPEHNLTNERKKRFCLPWCDTRHWLQPKLHPAGINGTENLSCRLLRAQPYSANYTQQRGHQRSACVSHQTLASPGSLPRLLLHSGGYFGAGEMPSLGHLVRR